METTIAAVHESRDLARNTLAGKARAAISANTLQAMKKQLIDVAEDIFEHNAEFGDTLRFEELVDVSDVRVFDGCDGQYPANHHVVFSYSRNHLLYHADYIDFVVVDRCGAVGGEPADVDFDYCEFTYVLEGARWQSDNVLRNLWVRKNELNKSGATVQSLDVPAHYTEDELHDLFEDVFGE